MAYIVDHTEDFEEWWDGLNEAEQTDITAIIEVLEEKGPLLGFPYSSGIEQSRHTHMRELRIQHKGKPYRVRYAFDPRRAAVLLIGGNKTGDKRWYDKYVPIADSLYSKHLASLKEQKKGK